MGLGRSTAGAPGRGRPDVVGCPCSAAADLSLGLRVPAFAGLTLALAVAAHVAGGGGLPSAGRMLFAVAAVTFTWWPLTAREVPWWLMTAGVAAVQVGVHLAFLDPARALAPHAAGHVHAPSTGGHATSVPVLAGHLLAALLVAWWLRRGESAAWAALRRVLPRLVHPVRVPAMPAARVRPAWAPRVLAQQLLDRRTAPRRGPPALAAV